MWFFKIASLQLVDSAFLPRCFCRTWSAHSSCTNGICVSSGIGRQFSSTCWQIFLRTRPCTGTVGWELTLSPVVSRRISTSLAKTSPSCLLSVSRCKRASRQYIRLDHFSVVLGLVRVLIPVQGFDLLSGLASSLDESNLIFTTCVFPAFVYLLQNVWAAILFDGFSTYGIAIWND